MQNKTILCVDSSSLEYPQFIGLEGEDIVAQEWLSTYSTAAEARKALRGLSEGSDVWVVSCDDMEGINLAAALKRDDGCRRVELVSFGGTGSEVGRCQAAGISLIRGKSEFARRYFQKKTECGFAAVKEREEENGGVRDDPAELVLEDSPVLFEVGNQEGLSGGGETDSCEVVSRDEPMPSVPGRPAGVSRSGFVVSVISGNGGVGKSTISVCLATLLQERGIRTALLDLDLQFGDVGFLLGTNEAFAVDELVAQPERVLRMEPKDGLPAVIEAPEKLEQSETVATSITEVIDLLRGNFDAVVVNTGSFWSDSHIQVIEASDKVLFVLDQRPSSVRACSRALDLCARCGVAVQPFRFVLNLCSKHALLSALDVSCALHGVQVSELKDGGREVGELLGAGLPAELMSSKNPFIESLRDLVPDLLPDHLRNAAGSSNTAVTEKKPLFSAFRKRRTA